MFRMHLIAAARQEYTVICRTGGSVVVSVGGSSQSEVMSSARSLLSTTL